MPYFFFRQLKYDDCPAVISLIPQGTIPYEIGRLSNLTYLRLSYNGFTGTAPDGLAEMNGLQLLQLQSNRITALPSISQLDSRVYKNSTFITDCGMPSAFDKAMVCKSCTMCCKYYSTAVTAIWSFQFICPTSHLTSFL